MPTVMEDTIMKKEIETKLIECHIIMVEALKGYEDRAFQSNKLFELRQYSNQLPNEMNQKITEYVNNTIRPMVYDVDYWSFIEKDEQYGSCDEKCRYNYKGKDTYAFVMSDRYIMALYTYCLSARKAVALENIEPEGLSEAELSMVKLESVREVLFQALLFDDVKFEDGKMYAELCTVLLIR